MRFFGHNPTQHTSHTQKELDDLSETIQHALARIEFLEAKDKAQHELAEMTNKKFDAINERIGELREMFKELSETNKNTNIAFQKTNALVTAVQPQVLLKEVQAAKYQVTVVDGKLTLLQRQHETLKNDADKFAKKLSVFKGEDELLKLQQKVREELLQTTKLTQIASAHATKIENNFIKIKEKTIAAENAAKELHDLKPELLDLKTALEQRLQDLNEANGARETQKLQELDTNLHQLTDLVITTITRMKNRQQELAAELSRLTRNPTCAPRLGARRRKRHRAPHKTVTRKRQ